VDEPCGEQATLRHFCNDGSAAPEVTWSKVQHISLLPYVSDRDQPYFFNLATWSAGMQLDSHLQKFYCQRSDTHRMAQQGNRCTGLDICKKKDNPLPWSTESQTDHTQYSLEHLKQTILQTQKASTNVESKEDDIELEQSMGNHVEDGCFLALCHRLTHYAVWSFSWCSPVRVFVAHRHTRRCFVTIWDEAVWNSVGRFEFLKELSVPVL
jgi:hypothetical protein